MVIAAGAWVLGADAGSAEALVRLSSWAAAWACRAVLCCGCGSRKLPLAEPRHGLTHLGLCLCSCGCPVCVRCLLLLPTWALRLHQSSRQAARMQAQPLLTLVELVVMVGVVQGAAAAVVVGPHLLGHMAPAPAPVCCICVATSVWTICPRA